MFKRFKKKSEIEILQKEYMKLISEAHVLSKTNRTKSDQLVTKAEAINSKIDILIANKDKA